MLKRKPGDIRPLGPVKRARLLRMSWVSRSPGVGARGDLTSWVVRVEAGRLQGRRQSPGQFIVSSPASQTPLPHSAPQSDGALA